MAVSLRRQTLVALAALAPLGGAGCGGLIDSYDYAEVTVSVADQRGRPLGEVPVALFTSRRVVEYASTDAQGRYTFRFVPFGEFGIAATPPAGYSTDYLTPPGGTVVADGLLIGEGNRVEVPLTITKICCATLVVRVQEPSGAPISGVRVTGYSQDFNSSRTTPADGVVRFEALPAANYGVVVDIPPGYAPAPGQRNFVDGLLPAIDEETVVTIKLTPACCGSIKVLVQEPSGAAVAGARVTAYSQGFSSSQVTSADAPVRFERLLAGNYGVVVDVPPGYSVAPGERNFADGILVEVNEEMAVTLLLVRS